MLSGWSLQRRLRLLALATATVASASFLVATLFVVRLSTATAERDEITSAVLDVTEVRTALEQQVNEARSALADGGGSVGGFLDASRPLDRAIGRLNVSIRHTGATADLEAFSLTIESWRVDMLREISRAQPVDTAEVEDRVRPAELGAAADELLTAAEAVLDVAEDDLSSARRAAVASVAGAAIAMVTMLTLIVRSTWKWAVGPTRRLAEQAHEVEMGNTSAPIGLDERAPSEFVALAATVDAMRHRLLDLAAEARSANAALRQEAPLVAAFRDALVPVECALPESVEVAARIEASEGVLAGDWYDIVEVQHGRIAVCVGDVAGHGPTAGLFAVVAKHAVLDALNAGRDPAGVLRMVAARYGSRLDFVTIWVGMLDPVTRDLAWAAAGHPPARIFDGEVTHLGPTGPLIGPFPGEWTTESTTLDPDALLVVCSDGVHEARNHNREYFGEERFLEACGNRSTAEACVTSVVEAVREHLAGQTGDDVTVVALRCADAATVD